MVKIVGFLKRKPGITRQEFKDYWLGQHIRLERASLQTQPARFPVMGPADFTDWTRLGGGVGGAAGDDV
jgi:hypothetical protein